MFDGEDGQRGTEKIGQTEWEVRIFSRVGKYKEEQNRDEEYKNGQGKKKKKTPKGINGRLVGTAEQISELEGRLVEITETGEKKERVRIVWETSAITSNTLIFTL